MRIKTQTQAVSHIEIIKLEFRILFNEETQRASLSIGKKTSVDVKMELVRKNFPIDRSQSSVMDYRENKNFYKSEFQLKSLPAA